MFPRRRLSFAIPFRVKRIALLYRFRNIPNSVSLFKSEHNDGYVWFPLCVCHTRKWGEGAAANALS